MSKPFKNLIFFLGEGATASSPRCGRKFNTTADQQQLEAESDRLNGNQQPQETADRGEHAASLSVATPPGSPSPSGYRNMGSIIKGSVMDKVTNVFGSASSCQNMGNTNNKESNSATGSGGSAASKAAEATSSNAINIPKGET